MCCWAVQGQPEAHSAQRLAAEMAPAAWRWSLSLEVLVLGTSQADCSRHGLCDLVTDSTCRAPSGSRVRCCDHGHLAPKEVVSQGGKQISVALCCGPGWP